MEAGPELDAAIATQVMGINGELSWNVLNADETASAYRGEKAALKAVETKEKDV